MKNIRALSISSIVSIGVVTLITVIGELAEPFKNGLKALTGHHWVTKSIIGMLLFVILAVILGYTTRHDNKNSAKFIWGVFFTTLVCSLVLLVFFTVHALL